MSSKPPARGQPPSICLMLLQSLPAYNQAESHPAPSSSALARPWPQPRPAHQRHLRTCATLATTPFESGHLMRSTPVMLAMASSSESEAGAAAAATAAAAAGAAAAGWGSGAGATAPAPLAAEAAADALALRSARRSAGRAASRCWGCVDALRAGEAGFAAAATCLLAEVLHVAAAVCMMVVFSGVEVGKSMSKLAGADGGEHNSGHAVVQLDYATPAVVRSSLPGKTTDCSEARDPTKETTQLDWATCREERGPARLLRFRKVHGVHCERIL